MVNKTTESVSFCYSSQNELEQLGNKENKSVALLALSLGCLFYLMLLIVGALSLDFYYKRNIKTPRLSESLVS